MANSFAAAVNAASNLGNQITDKVLGLIDKALQWGKDLVNGIARGIRNSIRTVIDAVINLTDRIKSTILNMLGISSPSKVFHEYGEQMMRGLAGGIAANRALPAEALAGAIPGPGGPGRGYGGMGGPLTIILEADIGGEVVRRQTTLETGTVRGSEYRRRMRQG
jgi:hypothetical protein